MSKIAKFAALTILSSSILSAESHHIDDFIHIKETDPSVYEKYEQDIQEYLDKRKEAQEYDTQIQNDGETITFTLTPRGVNDLFDLKEPRLTKSEADYLFFRCAELEREAMDYLLQAEQIAYKLEPDVRAALMAILGDAIASFKGSTLSIYTTVAYCLAEISYHYYTNYPEWDRCRALVIKAEACVKTAKQIQERLFLDQNSNENVEWIF